eukprot:TRINITY_DN12249_c0_g1_i1.p1 TRINITY_DN12249_c0_g1~~TRINITY_DN12249_c0_g1_i1.p1  ORF type:complete len:273 (+),score=50.14 TRINITY_DN12249_c0_g1_i1:1-819(+)
MTTNDDSQRDTLYNELNEIQQILQNHTLLQVREHYPTLGTTLDTMFLNTHILRDKEMCMLLLKCALMLVPQEENESDIEMMYLRQRAVTWMGMKIGSVGSASVRCYVGEDCLKLLGELGYNSGHVCGVVLEAYIKEMRCFIDDLGKSERLFRDYGDVILGLEGTDVAVELVERYLGVGYRCFKEKKDLLSDVFINRIFDVFFCLISQHAQQIVYHFCTPLFEEKILSSLSIFLDRPFIDEKSQDLQVESIVSMFKRSGYLFQCSHQYHSKCK